MLKRIANGIVKKLGLLSVMVSLPLPDDVEVGRAAVERGEVIACVLAGGEGTRLGLDGPKGACRIAGRTLFERIRNKVPKGQKLVLMTSEKNDRATRAFFEGDEDVVFWKQPSIPYRDKEGNELDEMGPNGNGALLDILDRDLVNQYKYMVVIPVDNPLADPYDLELIGAHIRGGDRSTLRCVERYAGEKVGLVTDDGIVDYTQVDDLSLGKHPYGHINLFCFDIPFMLSSPRLPMHWVEKKGVMKGETFLLDLVGFDTSYHALVSKREDWFFPIKDGSDVKRADRCDRLLLEKH